MSRFLLGFFSFGWLRGLDFLPPLLLRLFLAPLLWVSGSNKLGLFNSDEVIWLDPISWMNLDNPTYQATVSGLEKIAFIPEILAPLLANSIGLLEVMGAFLLFIGFAVRWISLPLLVLMVLTAFVALNGNNALVEIKSLLFGYADMNSSPFSKALVYFLLLLSLFFMGAGRFFSLDWFIYSSLHNKINDSSGWAKGTKVGHDIKPAPLVNNEANKNRISQDMKVEKTKVNN